MASNDSDLTFFTNDANQTLLDRFKATLSDTCLFDVLVGYFRSSGFYLLYDSIEAVEKTRILVGLGIDETAARTVMDPCNQAELDLESHRNTKTEYQDSLVKEVEEAIEPDDQRPTS